MTISANLESAVKSKNFPEIRNCLWTCLAFDISMTGKFKENLQYVFRNGIQENELFEIDDSILFDENATEENFDKLAGLLRVNFSKRKLDALRKIGEELSSSVQSDFSENKEQDFREPKQTTKTYDDNSSNQTESRQTQSSRTQSRTYRYPNSKDIPKEDNSKDGHSPKRGGCCKVVRFIVSGFGKVIYYLGKGATSLGKEVDELGRTISPDDDKNESSKR